MQVSFNPVIYNNNTSFKSYSYTDKGREYIPSPPTKDEITTAKIKKVVSELKYITFGVIALYFAMKRNFKYSKLDQIAKKEAERAKIPVPIPQLMDIKINPSEFVGG